MRGTEPETGANSRHGPRRRDERHRRPTPGVIRSSSSAKGRSAIAGVVTYICSHFSRAGVGWGFAHRLAAERSESAIR